MPKYHSSIEHIRQPYWFSESGNLSPRKVCTGSGTALEESKELGGADSRVYQ